MGWSASLPHSQAEAPVPQIPLKRTLDVHSAGPGVSSPQPRNPGGRGPLLPPSPQVVLRQLWGAPGRKNAEGCPRQMQASVTAQGQGQESEGLASPPDTLLSEGPSPALGTGSVPVGGIQARQVQELRVESHTPRGGCCPSGRICTAPTGRPRPQTYRTAGSRGAELEGGNTRPSRATGVTAEWGPWRRAAGVR